jgi:hypothetical protein
MEDGGEKERRWLRPLGLLLVVIALGMGSPLVLVGGPLVLLLFLGPGGGVRGTLVALVLLVLVVAGDPERGSWLVERGWAILVGGTFVAVSRFWPDRSFVERGLVAVGGGALWSALTLMALGGWGRIQAMVDERLQVGVTASMDVLRLLGNGGGDLTGVFGEAVVRTAEVQGALFPALLGLSTLAALGVAWWVYIRLSAGSSGGLSPLRSFRFPDPLIWVLIAGIGLMLVGGWSEGWGRVGANMVVFMVGLYALRGAGVLLFITGGLSLPAMLLVGVAALLVPPILVLGTMAVGVGDSWFDLRARGNPPGGPGSDGTQGAD